MIRRYNDDDDGEVIGHARGVIVPDGGREPRPWQNYDLRWFCGTVEEDKDDPKSKRT